MLEKYTFPSEKKKDISGGKDWQDAQTEAIILYFRNLPSSLKKKKLLKIPFKSQIVLSPGRHFSKLLWIYV